MRRLPCLAVFCLLCPPPAAAEELPAYPLRDLVVRAEAVVLATPLNPTEPAAYRVQEVFLADSPLARGDTVTLQDTSAYDLRLTKAGRDGTEEGDESEGDEGETWAHATLPCCVRSHFLAHWTASDQDGIRVPSASYRSRNRPAARAACRARITCSRTPGKSFRRGGS